MKKTRNLLARMICISIAVVLLVLGISSAFAFSSLNTSLQQKASLKNPSVLNIKPDGFWDLLFGKKDPTPTPTPKPKPTATPIPTLMPTPISSFESHLLIIAAGQKASIGYIWYGEKGKLHMTKTISDAFHVIKKLDNRTLEIEGLQEGEGYIMMKDNGEKVIDTCHVIVIPASASNRSFKNHNMTIEAGQKATLEYQWDNPKEGPKFTKTLSDEFQVTKKKDGHTLEVKCTKTGYFYIVMKDSTGNIIDICHVTVTPLPIKTPTPSVSETVSSSAFFSHPSLKVEKGQKVTLRYYMFIDDNNFQLTVTKTGTVQVTKKKNDHLLNITGLKVGEADIMIKDNFGKIIDTCHVTVNPATSKPKTPSRTSAPFIWPTPTPFRVTWTCKDNTSYDKNAYNDNICTSNLGEVRFVSDSQAIKLDPFYTPGKAGAPYYNNK